MNLTKDFTLNEFLISQTASRYGYSEQYSPSQEVINNLTLLCKNILQPLRDSLKMSISISSGYRCQRVNKATGGAETSQHLYGQASDIYTSGIKNSELFKKIQELKLPYDQLIWEFGTKQEPAWVHVSYSSKNRKQILYIGV